MRRLAFAIILWNCGAAAQQATNAGVRPVFQPFRFDENWVYLADSSRREDAADALKYLALGPDGWFVTLGGEIRERFELLDHPGFGTGPTDENGYLLQRYLLSSDFHFGSHFRFFGELQSALENGRRGGARPTDLDRLDLHQAFLDWRIGSLETGSLTVRIGRQEIGFGSGRLISPAEGLNVRRSLDGLRVIYRLGRWTWNAHALRLVKTQPGIFDDVPDNAQSSWGGGLAAPHPLWRKANISLYYLGKDRAREGFVRGLGRTTRQTVGSRSWKTAGAWDFNYEAIFQWGHFAGNPIRAWALSEDTGRHFSGVRFNPRAGFRADLASGDKGKSHKTFGSFDPLFAAAPVYSGPAALLGPTNLLDLSPSVTFQITPAVSLKLEASAFWRESLEDGIYSPFAPLFGVGRTRARYVGSAPSASLAWQANRHFLYTLIYTRFLTGRYLRDVGPGQDVNFAQVSASYRF